MYKDIFKRCNKTYRFPKTLRLFEWRLSRASSTGIWTSKGASTPYNLISVRVRTISGSKLIQNLSRWFPGYYKIQFGFSFSRNTKLAHLQPLEPLLFRKFSNLCTFILGGQFLLPQRANNQKRGFCQLQKWKRQRGLSALGIQICSFAASWATFVPGIFQLLHFHTGGPILITPEG